MDAGNERPEENLMPVEQFVEEWLSRDEDLFIISPIKGEPENIRLIPFVSGSGCTCKHAITIEKRQITGVQPRGYRLCCGRQVVVARVAFREGASIGIPDLFAQIRLWSIERAAALRDVAMRLPEVMTQDDSGGPGGGGGGSGYDPNECIAWCVENMMTARQNCNQLKGAARMRCIQRATDAYRSCTQRCMGEWPNA
jgi:hypothetical protein